MTSPSRKAPRTEPIKAVTLDSLRGNTRRPSRARDPDRFDDLIEPLRPMLHRTSALLSSANEAHIEYARDALKQTAATLKSLIKDNPDLLDGLIGRSIVHSSGFLKIPLFRPGNERPELRIHYWPKNSGFEHADIHNHGWEGMTMLLSGDMENEFYDLKAGEDFDLIYQQMLAGFRARQEKIGKCALVRAKTVKMSAGQTTHLPTNYLHQSVPRKDKDCLTLLARTPLLIDWSLIARQNKRVAGQWIEADLKRAAKRGLSNWVFG